MLVDNLSRGKFDEEFIELIEEDKVSFEQMDLTNEKDFQNLDKDFDYAYHLAAVNGTRYFYEMPEKLLKINLLSTINFLEWVSNTNCKNIFFSSSSETYAGTISRFHEQIPTPETIPLCIEDIFNPRFSYGGSKIIGELLMVNYSKKFNLTCKIIRYHNIYGPRMGYDHVIPEFCVRILKRENPFKIYGGTQTRAFCHVDDAVKASVMIMENSDTRSEIFHVGDEKGEISIQTLAEKLFTLTNFHPEVEILSPPQGSVERRCPSTLKLKNIGFVPTTKLEEGLEKTFSWYKSNFKN